MVVTTWWAAGQESPGVRAENPLLSREWGSAAVGGERALPKEPGSVLDLRRDLRFPPCSGLRVFGHTLSKVLYLWGWGWGECLCSLLRKSEIIIPVP